jgi:hypothetical protein
MPIDQNEIADIFGSEIIGPTKVPPTGLPIAPMEPRSTLKPITRPPTTPWTLFASEVDDSVFLIKDRDGRQVALLRLSQDQAVSEIQRMVDAYNARQST